MAGHRRPLAAPLPYLLRQRPQPRLPEPARAPLSHHDLRLLPLVPTTTTIHRRSRACKRRFPPGDVRDGPVVMTAWSAGHDVEIDRPWDIQRRQKRSWTSAVRYNRRPRSSLWFSIMVQTPQLRSCHASCPQSNGAPFSFSTIPVGCPRRAEYTLLGDVVNMEARLMQTALDIWHSGLPSTR
jgi:hypothetical protein